MTKHKNNPRKTTKMKKKINLLNIECTSLI